MEARMILLQRAPLAHPSIVFVDSGRLSSSNHFHEHGNNNGVTGFSIEFNPTPLQPSPSNPFDAATHFHNESSNEVAIEKYLSDVESCPSPDDIPPLTPEEHNIIDELVFNMDMDNQAQASTVADEPDLLEELLSGVDSSDSSDQGSLHSGSPVFHHLSTFDPSVSGELSQMSYAPVEETIIDSDVMFAENNVQFQHPQSGFLLPVADEHAPQMFTHSPVLFTPIVSEHAKFVPSMKHELSDSGNSSGDDSSIPPKAPAKGRMVTKKKQQNEELPPYLRCVRNPERKKGQNRDAANRYRSKKKGEMISVETKLAELRQQKEMLQQRVMNRRNEAAYLENLLKEINGGVTIKH